MVTRVAPYGTWESPISAQVVAAQGLRLGFVAIEGGDIYWLEGRPQEGGRNVLVRRAAGGTIADVTPPEFNVRTRVHEYGGGAYVVAGGHAYFSNFADQRVYRLPVRGSGKGEAALPVPLTPEGAWFYADYEFDRHRDRLICVREDHVETAREPVNTLVSLPASGGVPTVIASGDDFYSTPRLSPDGARLCWLSWRHPNMPWDGTELWLAGVAADGTLEDARRVAGSDTESIYQPGWSPDGTLYYVSDRSGYWHIYRWNPVGADAHVSTDPAVSDAEFGRPQWQFGAATWLWAGNAMVAACTRAGRWQLVSLEPASGRVTPLAPDIEPGEWLAAEGRTVALAGGSGTMAPAIVTLDLDSGATAVVRASSPVALQAGDVSEPEEIEFPTDGGLTAHAFYYPPRNRRYTAPAGERPPLIVISHGGPTTAAKAMLDLQIQFWTTRGFGVADVNYGGSSGYGRAYRQRLHGQWGIVDVADCVNAAKYLTDLPPEGESHTDGSHTSRGAADPRRMAIRGGSAGGYTTLAALTFHPGVFGAGASYYGVSDIEVLARDTHKFESRYLDSLVGPYPAAQDVYRARSPIHFVDRLACPLILLQGLEDKVVPPNQAQMMADAVRAKGLPVALLMFEGEQHGFRRAETIIRSLEAELYFYGVVFGFAPADRIEPIDIANT